MDAHFAPDFRLQIGGNPISAEMRSSVTRVNCESALEGADRVEVALSNDRLQWLDNRHLRSDNSLILDLGYHSEEFKRMFSGVITGKDATFPSGGAPTLTVVAQDRMTYLQKGNATRWFAINTPKVNIPIPDLITTGFVTLTRGLIPIYDPIGAALSIIVAGFGMIVAYNDKGAMEKMIRKQDGESDMEFLAKVAAENGWEMMIDHASEPSGHLLHFFSPLDHLEEDVTLRYGHSLFDFTPKLTEVGQIAAVSARLWWAERKMEFTVTVSWDWDRQTLDLSIQPGFGISGVLDQSPESLNHAVEAASERQGDEPIEETRERAEAARAQADAQREEQQEQIAENTNSAEFKMLGESLELSTAPRKILGTLLPKLNSRITGKGSTVGNPDIRPGAVLRIEGIGRQFGGLYRVTSANHTIDSGGYRTNFEVRKEIWFGSIPEPEQGAVPISLQGRPL